ncbi:hypothetical protein [Streptomyces sp. NPDC127114]|uniref:hypothetical protein n=1 Tax=Streptomyces sp. NPDC127114 TaxID=3345366 RepID=UPI003637A00A
MAALVFGDEDSATMRNAVFRLILSRVDRLLVDPADLEEVELARAIGSVSFNELEPAPRRRIAIAILEALHQLRSDVSSEAELEEPVLPGIDVKLDELIRFMETHLTESDVEPSK